jgi:hypothetical protein
VLVADQKEFKNSSFEGQALSYFREVVGEGRVQRLDGIECFSGLSDRWFWRWRLARMVRQGKLHKRHGRGNFWPSTRRLHHYGLPEINGSGMPSAQ